jgi:glucuronoarabinoxylan endo-1,4-beta-xylanase
MRTPIWIAEVSLVALGSLSGCTHSPLGGRAPNDGSAGGAPGVGGASATVATGGTPDAGSLLGAGGLGAGGGSGGYGSGGIQTGGGWGTGGTAAAAGDGGTSGPAIGGAVTGGLTGSVGGTAGSGGGNAGGGGDGGATGVDGGSGAPWPTVTVYLDRTHQTMAGFGITSTWAPALSDADADALFDPKLGIGLTILRVGMSSSGEPMSSNIYSDIKKAVARGVGTFIATVYSAPAKCRDTATGSTSGHLLASCYDTWATTMAAFPDKVKQNTGADLLAMSVQNEPDYLANDSGSTMLYAPAEVAAFVKVLGPKLKALNPPIKLIAPEATEWNRLWTNRSVPGAADPLLGNYDYGHVLAKDAGAWAQVDLVGAQMYESQAAELWPSDVGERKPVWMTEVCGVTGWPEAGPSSDINNGIVVARWIHDALTTGEASAWLWFWYKANGADDNEGLLLKDGTDTKRHYTLGNFSRFIRPGYARLATSGDAPAAVLLSAYSGKDGSAVIVAINQGTTPVDIDLVFSGGAAPASLTPWVTSADDNLSAKTAVSPAGGSFVVALPELSVTTFVGK